MEQTREQSIKKSETKSKTFKPEIHNSDYLEPFEQKKALAEDLIFTGGRKSISLDGDWNYAVDQYDTCLRAGWYLEKYTDEAGRELPVDYSFDTWPVMKLPCSYNMVSPELLLYEGPMVFTRMFDYDVSQTADKRVFLRIGAANYTTRVFINKKYVGMHRGGYTPFNFEITSYLENQNRVLIVVDSTRRRNQVPALNTDWFNYGGIYRSIELIETPQNYIKDMRVSLVPDGEFNKIEVNITQEPKKEPTQEPTKEPTKEVNITLLTISIPELDISEIVPIKFGRGSVYLCPDKDIQLWSPESPKLYTVNARLKDASGGVVDEVSDEVGFREFRAEGSKLLLNGKEIFLKGISMHEDSAATGRALTDEERLKRIKVAGELGCNYMRLSHYPHSEKMSRLADREGMLLWEEVPVYWDILFDNEETFEDASNQLSELVKRDFNRASVIIWSVGNENRDTDERLEFMSSLVDITRNADETRMISAACLVDESRNIICDRLSDKLDIIGINEYYGWYDPDFDKLSALFENSKPDKPVIITEFGADACPNLHGSASKKGTLEYQEQVYITQTEVLGSIPYVKGMSPWILHDFRCPRRTSDIQNYYNTKGLVDKDMNHKPAFDVLKEFYVNQI